MSPPLDHPLTRPPALEQPTPWPARRHALAAAGLLALYLFLATYHLGGVPLLDPDEPRYAGAARTMAEGGLWMIPEFNGAPRINKPPLFYWLIGLSDLTCGAASEVSARLPSVVMGLGMLALTVWLGARLFSAATGYLAGLILVTSPLFMALIRTCVIDQTFSTLLCGGIACLFLGLTGRWPWRALNPVLAAGVLMGLAFMAKGTAAVLVLVVPLVFVLLFARQELRRGSGRHWTIFWLIVGLAGVAWYLWQKWTGRATGAEDAVCFPFWAILAFVLAGVTALYCGLWTFWCRFSWVGGLLIALALSAWWYLLLRQMIGAAAFDKMVAYETAGRFAGQMHRQPFYFYVYVLPALFFPWSPALLSAVVSGWRRVTCKLPLEPRDGRVLLADEVRPVADAFLVAWALGVVLLFSVPGAKLATYMLPAFPALALLVARFLLRLHSAEEPIARFWAWLPALLAALMAAGLALLPSFPKVLPRDAQELFATSPVPLWAVCTLLILCTCVPWVWTCAARSAKPVAVMLPLTLAGLVLVAFPLMLNRLEFKSTSRDLCRTPEVQERLAGSVRLYTIGWEEEGLAYYLHREIHEIRKADAANGETPKDVIVDLLDAAPPGHVLLFAHRKKLKVYLGDGPLPNARELVGNEYVTVLVNEAAR